MQRRGFLKLSSLGAAGLASRNLWSLYPAKAMAEERRTPVAPVILQSPAVKIVFDQNDGLPYEYRLAADRRIAGEAFGQKIKATLCDRNAWTFPSFDVQPSANRISSDHVDFLFSLQHDAKPAAQFAIRYQLSGATLTMTLEEVRELPGFELIEVALPCLATVREEDGGAWLAHGDDGGSLVTLSDAQINEYPQNRSEERRVGKECRSRWSPYH